MWSGQSYSGMWKWKNVKCYLVQKENNRKNTGEAESGEQILKNDMKLMKNIYFMIQNVKHIPSMKNKK